MAGTPIRAPKTPFRSPGLTPELPLTAVSDRGEARATSKKTTLTDFRMAIPAGFEPATLCLEGRCSIQLSYGIIPADALQALQ